MIHLLLAKKRLNKSTHESRKDNSNQSYKLMRECSNNKEGGRIDNHNSGIFKGVYNHRKSNEQFDYLSNNYFNNRFNQQVRQNFC